jgi:hypothetical protein
MNLPLNLWGRQKSALCRPTVDRVCRRMGFLVSSPTLLRFKLFSRPVSRPGRRPPTTNRTYLNLDFPSGMLVKVFLEGLQQRDDEPISLNGVSVPSDVSAKGFLTAREGSHTLIF